MISPDLQLTDFQGAFLTSGYSYLYALALVPVGLLADKVDRPKLLAVGLALWSGLSIVSSSAKSFGELLVARTGFAVAQAAQNPVSFSLIPDLFPNNKSTALAGYNCAIYLGRALSFAAVLAAHRVGAAGGGGKAAGRGGLVGVGTMADAAAGVAGDDGVSLSMVPLDKLDLQRMSIIYTTGDMAAVTPLYNYNFHVIAYEAGSGLAVGGIVGGVGGGLIADWLSIVGGRYWLTAGASMLAAPFIAQSLLADSPGGSFSALLAGFALSEAWRAPGAIMIRSVAPQELGSTASALYLCIRNLIGGFGPVAVAKLAELVGLQRAMLLAPACYVISGLIFLLAEKEIEQQQQHKQPKLLS
eukprot:gene6751-6971_t